MARRITLESMVIGLGKYISLFCSSIFRVDPYPFCVFGCLYCFAARGRKANGEDYPYRVVSLFDRLTKILDSRGINNVVFRLSALTDPFIPSERHIGASLRIMKICLKRTCKLIINTRSSLLLDDPWLTVLRDLNKQKKVLVQLSITHIDDERYRVLEPNATLPSERFDSLKELARLGIPVVVRLQPLIPNFNVNIAEDIILEAYKKGARQIIVEFIKFANMDEVRLVTRRIGLNTEILELLPDNKQYGVKREVRRKILIRLAKYAEKLGLEFSTCKEGFISLHTARNCCGMHHLGEYKARRTIFDIISHTTDTNTFTEKEIRSLPRPIRRRLTQHEKALLKLYESEEYKRFLLDTNYN